MAPPVHSAVCLSEKCTTPGKLDAFRRALQLFPNPETIDLILTLVERHYEEPRYLNEPGMTELDRTLDAYLTGMVNVLLPSSPLDCPRSPTAPQLKKAVTAASGDVSFAQLFENLKFGRLMKGRLWFYAHDILWFDSPLLIRNELNRIRANFYETPVRLFAKLAYGKDVSAEESLPMMVGDVFEQEHAEACRRFAAVAGPECPDAELKPRARQIADVFDPFLHAMETLLDCAKKRLMKRPDTRI
jgi:hypothetical protein